MMRIWGTLALALALSGCVSFGSKPPASLINLSASEALQSGVTRTVKSSETITIGTPTVPQAVAVNRIAVSAGGTEIAYVKDAQWVEPPARLFQRLLVETLGAKNGLVALDPRQFAANSGMQLHGQIRSFGISVDFVGASTGTAVVIYDAALSRDRGQKVATRRFEARIPVARIDGPAVGSALNRAANKVAGDVSDWIASP